MHCMTCERERWCYVSQHKLFIEMTHIEQKFLCSDRNDHSTENCYANKNFYDKKARARELNQINTTRQKLYQINTFVQSMDA